MTSQHAERHADRPESQTERPADEFSAPLHPAILATPPRGRSKGPSPLHNVPSSDTPASTGSPSNPATAAAASTATVHRTALRHLRLLHTGKVRDIYEVDAQAMLIVTTDRLSAFDVVLPDPIPHKGRVLTEISNFWFARTGHIVPNQLTGRSLDDLPLDVDERALLEGRAIIVRRLEALPVEAVVRGYLIGSGWKDYQRSGSVCGIALPQGLRLAEKLPQPLFTPASKAPAGEHDENIGFDEVVKLVGAELAAQLRDTALRLYEHAAAHALARGIIVADTKFEFGVDAAGRLHLIDEVVTPDSSRFWPADTYRAGISPPSFDKQFVRDYLETLDWNKKAPGPSLPAEIIARTSEKYREALARITGPALAVPPGR
ncbi:MAG: phosphoribosylaminoimidazolesuccinocarboxamide synthase [Gammaproteobacteria bacterium]|nr:phosphoribosylaminoimidazolesuccinocarboxamide synthase [Gammaproteobacteria bacterium]